MGQPFLKTVGREGEGEYWVSIVISVEKEKQDYPLFYLNLCRSSTSLIFMTHPFSNLSD